MQYTVKNGINASQLKIIALVCMTLDHIAAFGLSGRYFHTPMRIIGRIAAPLFLFLLVQGIKHTRNKSKYILRLYIAGALIQIFNTLLDPNQIAGYGNILPTFMYTVLFIVAIERITSSIKGRKWRHMVIPILTILVTVILSIIYLHINRNGIGGILLRIFAPSIFRLEYSFLFVLLGIAWYFIKNPIYNCAIFAILSAICGLVDVNVMLRFTAILPFNFFQLFIGTQWCMILAIPFMLLYNGNKGKGGKWFFYVYYPLHQYVIYALASLV